MSQLCAYSIGIEENNLSMLISYIKYAKNKHTDRQLSMQHSVNERTLDFFNLLRYFRYIWQSFHRLFFIYSIALVCFSNLSITIFWYGLWIIYQRNIIFFDELMKLLWNIQFESFNWSYSFYWLEQNHCLNYFD